MAPNGWPAALDSLADTTLTHPGILKVASGLEISFPHDCNKWPGFYVAGKQTSGKTELRSMWWPEFAHTYSKFQEQ